MIVARSIGGRTKGFSSSCTSFGTSHPIQGKGFIFFDLVHNLRSTLSILLYGLHKSYVLSGEEIPITKLVTILGTSFLDLPSNDHCPSFSWSWVYFAQVVPIFNHFSLVLNSEINFMVISSFLFKPKIVHATSWTLAQTPSPITNASFY